MQELNMKLGAVLFEGSSPNGAGWACKAGKGESAKRISSPEELSADTIWWSNVSMERMHKLHREGKLTCLRHERYFRADREQVLQEWGVLKPFPELMADPGKQCEFLARVFARIMILSYKLIRECTGDVPFSEAFTGLGLSDDLETILPRPGKIKGLYKNDSNAVRHSSGIVTTGERSIRSDSMFHVRRNRMLHAREALSCIVPEIDAPLQFQPNPQMPSTDSERGDSTAQKEFPAITKVIIKSLGNRHASLFGISRGRNAPTKVFHHWVSPPELLVLSEFARLEVCGSWMCNRFGPYLECLAQPVRHFLTGTQFECSWSSGIVAESIFIAAARMEKRYRHPSNCRTGPFSQRNWQAECITRASRKSMFDRSHHAAGFGFTVYSYGYGWMNAGAVEGHESNLIRHCIENGMVPFPADKSRNTSDILPDSRMSGTGNARLLDHAMATANSSLIRKLDNASFSFLSEGR